MSAEDAPRDGNFVPAALFQIDGAARGQLMAGQIDEATGRVLVDNASSGGTVTSVSVVSANGFAGSVANPTTTPAITLSTTINAPVLAGNGTAISAATTTGSTSTVVLQTSPTLITPVLGVATATSINGLTVTASTGTLTIANGKTLTQSNTLTYTGTDGSSVNFGTGGTVLYSASTIPLTVGTTTIASGTDTRILYDNAGVLGEYTLTGSGTVVAMQTAPSFLTSITTPSVLASANDSGALGASGTAFSDLFLASGAVINFNAGNVTLTHSAGILTQNAGEFRITSANVGTNADSVPTLSSTSTLTNKTLTSPTINSATLGGTATFAEGGAIAYDSASSADGVYTGFVRAGTAGATLAFGDLVYLASADSRWELADADAATTSDRFLGMCVLAAAADGDPTTILLMGFIRADAAFPTMTIGSAMYVGETAGDIQVAIPTGADNVIRRVGYAWTADELYFNPSMDSQITVA